MPDLLDQALPHRFIIGLLVALVEAEGAAPADLAGADVAGQDQYGVAEIDLAPEAVGEMAFIQDLEQDVKDIGVRLFDFVKEDHRIGMVAYLLSELPALFITDIARRRAGKPGDRELFHELRHIDTDQGILALEEVGGEFLGELGLADPGRS